MQSNIITVYEDFDAGFTNMLLPSYINGGYSDSESLSITVSGTYLVSSSDSWKKKCLEIIVTMQSSIPVPLIQTMYL